MKDKELEQVIHEARQLAESGDADRPMDDGAGENTAT